jgi:hypothetical protein
MNSYTRLTSFYGLRISSRLTFNGLRYNCLTSIASSSEKDPILEWARRYRIPINICVKKVAYDSSIDLSLAHVTKDQWNMFLTHQFRRKLVKDPTSAMSMADIKDLCFHFERLSFINNDNDTYSSRNEDMESNGIQLTDADIEHISMSCAIVSKCAKTLVLSEMKALIESNKLLSQMSDMRLPHEWYPYARLMKRKIIVHAGIFNVQI